MDNVLTTAQRLFESGSNTWHSAVRRKTSTDGSPMLYIRRSASLRLRVSDLQNKRNRYSCYRLSAQISFSCRQGSAPSPGHCSDILRGREWSCIAAPSSSSRMSMGRRVRISAASADHAVIVSEPFRGPASPLEGVPLWRQMRFQVVVLTGLALVLCNADRTIMSVAIMPLSRHNGWGEGVAGIVQSSFLAGYLLTPIAGGALADRYGGRNVLAAGILVWSTATLATPYAAQHSLGALLLVRALMGLGEGVALPCVNNLMARWVPSSERARAVGACFVGFHLGSVAGLLAAPPLLASQRLGVGGPFVVFGILGYAWLFLWLTVVSSDPGTHPRMTPQELRYITSTSGPLPTGAATDRARGGHGGSREEVKEQGETRSESAQAEGNGPSANGMPPFGMLLSRAPTWALIFANAVNSWGFFIMLSWMPTYFSRVFGTGVRNAAWFSAGPWAMMALTGMLAGVAADGLSSRGVGTTRVRKVMQTVGFMGPCLSLVGVARARSAEVAALWLTAALGFSAFSQAGFLVNYQDIGPRYAGVLHGMSNTAGTLAGMVSVVFTGFLVQRLGSFQKVLTLSSFVYFAGLVVWNMFATGDRVFH